MKRLSPLLFVLALGCASSPADTTAVDSFESQTRALRASLRTLRQHQHAASSAVELDQAEVWLLKLERSESATDADLEFSVVEGQLALVKARLEKLTAQSKLNDLKAQHELRKTAVSRLQSR